MKPNKDYLFVYGTLRKNYELKLKEQISNELEFIGTAKVGATLYDLGNYPGAIKEKGEVIGDVFFIHNLEKVFSILDAYEGDDFTREREWIQLESGDYVQAWIYWYNKTPEGKQKIHDTDYLNYLKNKKTA